MLNLANNVYKNICRHKLIRGEHSLLIAFSGGQDSACLLLILYLLQARLQLVFGYIWLNHFWQTSSFFTMLHVSRCSYSFCSKTVVYLPFALVVSEKTAREWRHSSIQRTRMFYRYELCVQGHNKSDRVETVLFNLIRGTGRFGVSALHWKLSSFAFCQNRLYPTLFQFSRQTHYRAFTERVSNKCLTCSALQKQIYLAKVLLSFKGRLRQHYNTTENRSMYHHLKQMSTNRVSLPCSGVKNPKKFKPTDNLTCIE